jgi:hypothetical protein
MTPPLVGSLVDAQGGSSWMARFTVVQERGGDGEIPFQFARKPVILPLERKSLIP